MNFKKNNSIKKLITFFLISLFVYQLNAQNSYKITVKSDAFKDSTIYLGYHYGKFQYSRDTATFNNKGIAVFQNKDKELERGIYFIILPNKQHLDFIINEDQNISFVIDTSNLSNTKVSGSKENQDFFTHNLMMQEIGSEMSKLKNIREKYEIIKNDDSVKIITDKMKALNEKAMEEKQKYIINNPTYLTAKVFNLTKDPEIPEFEHENDSIKRTMIYEYYKNNYWKNMDFKDDALIKTPVFHPRLERFVGDILIQEPDTIIKEIDILIAKAENNKEIFKYIVWFLTFHYETSQIMGQDKIFVHLVDKYYKTDKAFWASETVKNNMIEKANKQRNLLIGSKAPNMALVDTSFTNYLQLWAIRANYTIMLFWDPSCGHCKKEIDRLNKFYKEYGEEYGIAVYTICSDTSLTKWKSMIHEKNMQDWINVNGTRSALGNFKELYDIMATPQIFLLDNKKKIIAKRIGVETLTTFLPKYDANKRDD